MKKQTNESPYLSRKNKMENFIKEIIQYAKVPILIFDADDSSHFLVKVCIDGSTISKFRIGKNTQGLRSHLSDSLFQTPKFEDVPFEGPMKAEEGNPILFSIS